MFRLHKPAILLLAGLTLCPPSGGAQWTWFTDDFRRPLLGPAWTPVGPEWRCTDSALAVRTASYDQLLACTLRVSGTDPYVIEVLLRGPRAGLFFCVDDPATKAVSQMVRFDDATILSGHFPGNGEFRATGVFDAPHDARSWTTLRLEIDPEMRQCRILVDGTLSGVDTLLRHRSGFIGLQASDGLSEFRSLRVFGGSPSPGPAPLVGGAPARFDHVRDVRVNRNGIHVIDPVRKVRLTLDQSGVLLSQQSLTGIMPRTGSGTPVRSGQVYAAIEGKALLFTNRETGHHTRVTDRLVSPVALLAGPGPSVYVADPGAEAIFRFDLQGRQLGETRALLSGGFHAPRGLALLDSSRILVADHDRLLVLPADLREAPPRLGRGADGALRLSWNGSERNIQLTDAGGRWSTAAGSPDGPGAFSTSLDLPPLTRFSVRVPPPLQSLPPSSGTPPELRFCTPPPPGMLALIRIPVMLMVYRTISYRDAYRADRYPRVPDGRSLSDEDVSYLRRAAAFNTEFFYRNSSCAVVLDFDIFVVDDTLRLREVGPSDPYWLGPAGRVTRDFERAAASFRRSPEYYNGLIVPYAWLNHPPRRTSALRDPSREDTLTIRQMYGGGTYGVPAPWAYGATSGYTGNPFQDRFSRQDWLITHEFHHQIDALMEAAGYADYHHADQPWKMAGEFGEDFDFNAAIIRAAGREPWLALRAGQVVAVADADADGLPDDDPSLPFDERRLGSRPDLADTDADGLSDLAEVTAGIERGADPRSSDTDGDGTPDGSDSTPLNPVDTRLRRTTAGGGPTGDDRLRTPFAGGTGGTLFFLSADDSALHAGVAVPPDSAARGCGFLLQIDAAGDGWFHGFENTQVRIRWTGDSIRVQDYYLRDCSSWSDPPQDRKDILTAQHLRVEHMTRSSGGGEQFVLLVRVPFDAVHGPFRDAARAMRVRFGFQRAEDRWVWEEAWERNVMIAVQPTVP